MRTSRRMAVLGLAVLSLYLLRVNGGLRWLRESVERGRMKNVVLLDTGELAFTPVPLPAVEATPTAVPEPEPESVPEPDAGEEIPLEIMGNPRSEEVREATIRGGLSIKNETGYSVDPGGLLIEGPGLRLPAEWPQILILHTHGSEAYTQAGLDRYEANDSYRTEDTGCNVVRVGTSSPRSSRRRACACCTTARSTITRAIPAPTSARARRSSVICASIPASPW